MGLAQLQQIWVSRAQDLVVAMQASAYVSVGAAYLVGQNMGMPIIEHE